MQIPAFCVTAVDARSASDAEHILICPGQVLNHSVLVALRPRAAPSAHAARKCMVPHITPEESKSDCVRKTSLTPGHLLRAADYAPDKMGYLSGAAAASLHLLQPFRDIHFIAHPLLTCRVLLMMMVISFGSLSVFKKQTIFCGKYLVNWVGPQAPSPVSCKHLPPACKNT